jgi:hypothetical protein
LTAKIVLRQGRKRRSISTLEGIVLRQAESALKGSDRAALATLKMAAEAGLLRETASTERSERRRPVAELSDEELVEELREMGVEVKLPPH